MLAVRVKIRVRLVVLAIYTLYRLQGEKQWHNYHTAQGTTRRRCAYMASIVTNNYSHDAMKVGNQAMEG